MTIEMPRGLPFSVDTWTPSSKKKRHHFLTHAHKDHSAGVSAHSSFPIYSTHLTKTLLLHCYPQLDGSMFVDIEVGQSVVIEDPDGSFTVTALDANHCPGAVMFLFEGPFGNILHTGDCRLTPECLLSLPEKYVGRKDKRPRCQLDYVFLDCTFGKFSQKMPSKHSAIRQVINCIWKHPDAPVVYLTCDLLGQEEILTGVYKTFGSKIFVDEASNPEFFQALTSICPEIISRDPSSRFRIFNGFPQLSERAQAKLAEARANSQPEPLIIRPSAQWYACEEESPEAEKSRRKLRFNEAVRDQFGVWHVCYSMHSSREELEWALQLLAPKWVVSTTTTSCRAMELSYVQKNCSVSHIASDDPLWKLLDIGVEASQNAVASASPVVECAPQISEKSQLHLHPTKTPANPETRLALSPPGKTPTVTLFGRARLGLQSSAFLHEQKKHIPIEETHNALQNRIECEFLYQGAEEVARAISEKSLEKKLQVEEVIEIQCGKSVDGETEVSKCSSFSPIGSSKSFNTSLRSLYRSNNVAVPRPLPSLVELMNTNKRARKRYELL